MAKYDLAFKLVAVKLNLSGEGGYKSIADNLGISDTK